ncbi:MAG: hypothetical protein JW864_03525, partial [Spirochaetes bacterium]|nr:hypothetical protein [Spirochaetota bacterium]
GKRSGKGTMMWASGPRKGDTYTGRWSEDEINGEGKYTYSDGSTYEGEFKDGKKHGKGTMTWASGKRKGEKYSGEWYNDNMHGIGEYVYTDGSVYKGRFNKGKRNGYGVMEWKSGKKKGEKYSGEWKDDNMHGTGVYTYSDGAKKSGKWNKGKWLGRVKAKDSNSKLAEKKKSKPGRSGKSVDAVKNSEKSGKSGNDEEVAKLFDVEYIYIEKDWSNWYMIYGENLENYIKDKKLQIEYIDGNAATASFDSILMEREVGFNRWKKYWKIKSSEGTITKVPETSIWRIKVIKK